MVQRFIELGEGYSDLYELLEMAEANKHRIVKLLAFHSEYNGKQRSSAAAIMAPTPEGNFQAIYLCREGIPDPRIRPSKRYELFTSLADRLQKQIFELEIKPSEAFADKELFYQYLIGILRMNKLLPNL
ncbi:MAG TPA: methylthioribose kinase [Bacillaceae bacterium]